MAFPLDGAFATLRREVEAVTTALAGFRADVRSAGAAAAGSSSSASPSAPASRASAVSNITRDLSQVSAALGALKQGISTGSNIAKALGLDEASQKLRLVAVGAEKVGHLLAAVAASVKLIGVLWKPTIVAVTVIAGSLLGLQAIIERLTGSSFTLNETLGVALLQIQKSSADAVRAFGVFVGGVSDETMNRFAAISADAEARMADIASQADRRKEQAEQARLKARRDAAGEGGALPMQEEVSLLERSSNLLKDYAETTIKQLNDLLGIVDESQTRQAGTASSARSSGQSYGQEYTSGLSESIQQGGAQINEELLQALTVDPDDGEVITSFKDLWKNIGKVFSQSPIGFLGGLFGSSGVGGGGGMSFGTGGGFAHGGRIGTGYGASLAHMFGRGFAGGGRPSGLDPRDVVPIWAQPGEWVIRAQAAAKYGSSAMAALNAGLIDSGALQAIAGGLNVPAPARHSASGYALGGAIPAGAAGSGGGSVLPLMVVDQSNAALIVRQGKNALLELLNEDPDFSGFRR